MLGFISQNYRIYTIGQTQDDADVNEPKTMAKAYRDWIDRIKEVATRKLVPSLKDVDMIVSEEVFRKYVSHDVPYHLAGIQNFSGLIPVSQKLSKPIYELTQKEGNWSGARWKWNDKKSGKEHGIMVNIKDADAVYTNLSKSILGMIGSL